jgi:hypothetical protein
MNNDAFVKYELNLTFSVVVDETKTETWRYF